MRFPLALMARDAHDPSLPLTNSRIAYCNLAFGKPVSVSFSHVLKFDLAQF